MTAAVPKVRIFADAQTLARAAADETVARAADAIARRGRFLFALSGGSTPRALFGLLAESPLREQIAWPKVELFFSDERAVEPDHPASNYRMARETLLDKLDLAPGQIHRMPAERADRDAAAREHEAELTRVAGSPPRLDLVLLGMGTDAHTASLFPRTPALHERERFVAPGRAPVEPFERLTLTLRTLNAARGLLLLVSGPDKAAPLAEVLEGQRDPERLPCQSLAPSDGELLWLVDAAAAARLHRSSR